MLHWVEEAKMPPGTVDIASGKLGYHGGSTRIAILNFERTVFFH